MQLTFNNLKTDGSSTLASFGERVGNQNCRWKMTISVEGKELALLEGMEISGKSDLVNDGKTINSQLDYSLNSLKVQNQDLGSGKLTLKSVRSMAKPGISLASNITRKLRRCWHSQRLPTILNFIRRK